ncbi:hypothetical protein INT47_011604 [Mucor saturninus]|uniref:Box C/D snoRNA protein 1 n=1 Tax=Mucor saturninus TaxID=64648 RepID=A0A8H7R6P0_9FUNG|nr:hypothetical protein INT47_011604 [Mucor saturninus]
MTDLNKDPSKIVSSRTTMESSTFNTPTDPCTRPSPLNMNPDTSNIDPSMCLDPEDTSSMTAVAGTDIESVTDSLDNISNVSVAGSIASFDTNSGSVPASPPPLENNTKPLLDVPVLDSQSVIDSSMEEGGDTDEDTMDSTLYTTEEQQDTDMEQPVESSHSSSNMDPEIEMEEDIPPPPPPPPTVVLSPEEIEQAKKCQVCKTVDWKYTCPRCLTHTCSLTCVRLHKSEAACSGIRDKTAYVPMREYNESTMMSDYTYLEDVSRQSDNLTRSRSDTSKSVQGKAAEARAKVFNRTANQMGIHFTSLPAGMSRHKLNQSNYSKNLRQIFWSMEVNFCREDKKERFLEHSFPSGKPFEAFFQNLLFAEKPIGKSNFGITRHQLKDFISAGMEQFVVALKKEKAPRGHFVHVTDMLHQPFKDVLKSETIIEYPIFYIWLKSDGLPKEVVTLEEKKQWIAVVKDEPVVVKEEEEEASATILPVKEEVDVKQEQDVSCQPTVAIDGASISSKEVKEEPSEPHVFISTATPAEEQSTIVDDDTV